MNRAGKITGTIWFSECIGFIRVEQSDKEVRYYVGYIDHDDFTIGAYEIALWGSKFPKKVGDVLFSQEG